MADAWVLNGPRRIALDAERLAARAATLDVEPAPHLTQLPEIHAAIADALAHPVDSPRLRELARGARRVVIAIPDGSRPCPTFLLLPALLDELNAAGVTDDQVQVMVACGVHRATTTEEKAALAGGAASSRVTVTDAQGLRQVNVFLNQTRHRAPAFMNLQLARADLVVAVGIVEPHLYAGFSGGAKTVAIGCAGARTIAWTHHPRFLDQPGVELGRLAGNPFQEAVRELAAMTSLRFAFDAVVDTQGHAVALAAGEPSAAQAELAGGERDAWLRTVQGRYDLVVAGLPAPKNESLYHATRAATYLALGDRSPVADEGLILLCASVEKGVGDGPGEANFGALMAGAERPETLLERGRRGEPLGPGGQRAYMMAKVLARCRAGVLQPADEALCRTLGLVAFTSVEQAIEDTARRLGHPPRVLVVSDGIGTIVHSSGVSPDDGASSS